MRRFPWLNWRRDLAAGLIGSVIATALLVLIGWSRIQDEKAQTHVAWCEMEAREAECR